MRIPFNRSERASLGIEWELELVDLTSRELTPLASEILDQIRPAGQPHHPRAKHELFESTIEVITGVCQTVEEAVDDLRATVAEVTDAAAERGAGLICSGSHPFSDWALQKVSPDPRYARLLDQMQLPARQLLTFGVHVHVGVRAVEKVIPIVNALTQYVPHFLALSASSPFWVGADTGLASVRTKIFEQLPTAGLPQQLASWKQFEAYMDLLIRTKAISSIREVWWDIRPHPDFGTVEVRICDGLPTLEEVAAVGAMTQCLVERLDREYDRGYTLPVPRGWVVRENKWRAARHGINAEVIVDDRGTVVPVADAITDLVEDLMPIARRLGCSEQLSGVERILAAGPSYARQRAVAEAHEGDLRVVVDSLLVEARDGLRR
jgi:YbdK family carboxylate-amine ligase